MEKSKELYSEPEPQGSDVDGSALEGWSKEDKYHLHRGLKKYGSSDIESIQRHILSKSTAQTVAAINHYRAIAMKSVRVSSNNTREAAKGRSAPSTVPLATWAEHLTESRNFKELQTECAEALRIIADLEDRPDPTHTGNINFKEMYKSIADVLEGKPFTGDQMTNIMLEKCITETALRSKTFISDNHLNSVLEGVELAKDNEESAPGSDDYEQIAVQLLATQANYNPLKIPEVNLKASN